VADQGRWFKLWVSSRSDPSLSILPIAEFGRWCKLGVYTKEHGTDGVVSLERPQEPTVTHPLQSDFQVPTFDAILVTIRRFPNITIAPVSPETNTNVSFKIEWRNWGKYQGDFSTHRVRKYRAKKRKSETPKKRGEEKRGSSLVLSSGLNGFQELWKEHPGPKGSKQEAQRVYLEVKPPAGCVEALKAQLEYKIACDRRGVFCAQLPHLHRWLKKRRWEDELPTSPESTPERLWREAQEEKQREP
jgi:hypothetical protein